MLHWKHTASSSAALLYNWVILPFRKGKNMRYCFTKIDLIVFYRSSICKSIFSLGHILNKYSYKVNSHKQKRVHPVKNYLRSRSCIYVRHGLSYTYSV